MCNLSEGIAEEAREEAWEEATLKNLRSLIKTAKIPIDQAMDMLEAPTIERSRYAELLGQ